jgi:hypothetical protein
VAEKLEALRQAARPVARRRGLAIHGHRP